jgi:hypothetical protein
MSEVTQARDHLKKAVLGLYEAIVLRDYAEAEEHAADVINLIAHLRKIEKRNTP